MNIKENTFYGLLNEDSKKEYLILINNENKKYLIIFAEGGYIVKKNIFIQKTIKKYLKNSKKILLREKSQMKKFLLDIVKINIELKVFCIKMNVGNKNKNKKTLEWLKEIEKILEEKYEIIHDYT